MGNPSPLGAFKGCVVFLGVFALSAVIVGIATYLGLPREAAEFRVPAAVATGLGGGFFVALAAAFLSEFVQRARELRMLQASVSGVTPQDGARVAACGVVVADGPLLVAPLSGVLVAIYKYEIRARQQKGSTEVCSGYGLTPCHLETPAGYVRLLGYADLAFTPRLLEGPEMWERARAYLASAPITPIGVGAAKEFLGTLVDDDGAIRSDTGVVPDDLANPRLSFLEHVVTDRESVCAFGRYSAERGGLVPDPASIDPYPVRLRRGDATAIRRSLLRSAAGYLAGAALMASLAAGVVWLVGTMFAT